MNTPRPEGQAMLLKQRGFTLAEPAIFLRFHPRGSSECVELAVFVRTGNVCPPEEWANVKTLPTHAEYQAAAKRLYFLR